MNHRTAPQWESYLRHRQAGLGRDALTLEIADVAKLTYQSRETVRRHIRDGRLHGKQYMPRGRYQLALSAVAEYLAGLDIPDPR